MEKIMFNDRYGLTDAVIEGRNIMTRRLIDPMPPIAPPYTKIVGVPIGRMSLCLW